MSTREHPALATSQSENGRLESWKDIASYLGRDVRTVQRWEKREGLPVHRLQHEKQSTVYAYKCEIDAWWRASEEKVASEIEPPEIPADESPVQTNPEIEEEQSPRWTARRWAVVVLVVLVLQAVGIVTWRGWRGTAGAARQEQVRVLVLPFDNLSGDANQLYFSMGMTDEVIAELTQVNQKEIAVIARATAERVAGKSVAQIRKELEVEYVLEGSVLRDGDHVRITVELIHAPRETHLWAKSYEAEVKDVIGVQRDVAREIASEIGARAANTARPGAKQVYPAAYDAFLRGRYFWNKRGVDSLEKSFEFFQEAIRLDPNYAPAYAGLADAYALLGSAQTGALPPTEGFPAAKKAAQKALEIDETLAEAHASLGYELLVYEHDFAGSEKEFRRAIALNPHYATAHQWFGLWYIAQGRTAESIASVKRALEEDPLSLPANISLAEAYYFARDYERTIAQSKRAIELDSDSALAHYNLGRAFYMKKDYPQAIEQFKRARASSPYPATLVPLAMVYAAAGDAKQASAHEAELKKIASTRFVPAIFFALIDLGRGDKDRVFSWLDKAAKEHCDYMVFLDHDPMADPLRGDKRFAELVVK